MGNFPILDLVVGMIFIYFLLSIVCSSIIEIILTYNRIRAKVLGQWLLRIFDTPITVSGNPMALGQAIMDHCATTALSDTGRPPSYIDAKNFTSALLDKVHAFSAVVSPTSIDEMIKSLQSTTAVSGELKNTFLMFATEAKDTYTSLSVKTSGAIEMFKNKLENWYDSNQNNLIGVLKTNYTRKFTCIAAVVVTLLINADSIQISKYLYSNPEARAKLAAAAIDATKNDSIKSKIAQMKAIDTTKEAELTLEQFKDTLADKMKAFNTAKAALTESLPLGWNATEFEKKRSGPAWFAYGLSKLVGMALTVLAIMMGAPFWFDVLNKVSNIRGAGKKPDDSTKK